jgi:hypothetical protein
MYYVWLVSKYRETAKPSLLGQKLYIIWWVYAFFLGYESPLKYMKAWYTDSLEQKIVLNLQQKSLYRTKLLTTDHNVRKCTCISEADRGLCIMGAVLFQKPFLFRNIKRYRGVIQSENYKTWQIEKWQGRNWKCSVKYNMLLPVYQLAQHGGRLSGFGEPYVSLRGWPFDSERDLEFCLNKYSDQVMSNN